ncbi:MAG: hypothetical protein SFW35_10355 [Chitinophagales bacterium]|nr:hypothetical protein [Chitinophagales bacterium]
MITAHIQWILIVTGSITGLMLLQFLFPQFYAKKVLRIKLNNEASRFYFAHWGVVVFSIAVLLVWSAWVPEMCKPVVIAALLEKAVLAVWILKDFRKTYARRIIAGAVFDTFTCIIYILYLLGF